MGSPPIVIHRKVEALGFTKERKTLGVPGKLCATSDRDEDYQGQDWDSGTLRTGFTLLIYI